jgi:hypothetical protein
MATQRRAASFRACSAGSQDCSAKVKYRYNTCAGDCGTVDGHEITCTCEVTSPVTCPNLIKPPRLEIPIS